MELDKGPLKRNLGIASGALIVAGILGYVLLDKTPSPLIGEPVPATSTPLPTPTEAIITPSSRINYITPIAAPTPEHLSISALRKNALQTPLLAILEPDKKGLYLASYQDYTELLHVQMDPQGDLRLHVAADAFSPVSMDPDGNEYTAYDRDSGGGFIITTEPYNQRTHPDKWEFMVIDGTWTMAKFVYDSKESRYIFARDEKGRAYSYDIPTRRFNDKTHFHFDVTFYEKEGKIGIQPYQENTLSRSRELSKRGEEIIIPFGNHPEIFIGVAPHNGTVFVSEAQLYGAGKVISAYNQ